VVNLGANLVCVLLKPVIVLRVLIGDVVVHLIQVGPGFLGLTIAGLLQGLASIEPVGLIADHPVVLIGGVLVHLIVLFSGERLDVLMVSATSFVSYVVVAFLLLASVCESLCPREVKLGKLVLVVFGLLLLILLVELFTSVFLPLLNDLLNTSLFLDLVLLIPNVLVALDSLSLILTQFAAKMHLVVSFMRHEDLILRSRLHMHVPVGSKSNQICRDNRVLHCLLLVFEHIFANACIGLR